MLQILPVSLDGSLVQFCVVCGAENKIPVAGLELGVGSGDHVCADLVQLPACACGNFEFLSRTFDVSDASNRSLAAEHRRLVNDLAVLLKSSGRSHPACKAIHDAEGRDPEDRGPRFTDGEHRGFAAVRAAAKARAKTWGGKG